MKMNYAVAVISFFDNENKVFWVKADNEIDAMIEALNKYSIQNASSSNITFEADDEHNKFLKTLTTVEEVQRYCFDGEIGISKPLPLPPELDAL
jgi:hypothetical protein